MNHDILVVVEQRNQVIQKVAIELIGEAKKLSADTDGRVVALLMGHHISNQSELLCHYGADSVLVVDHPLLETYTTEPYTKAICHVLQAYAPEIVLFGATSIGRDLAPRVAGRVHTGLTADCTSLDIDPESKLLLMTRPAFGGNIMATIVCRNYRPQMATVRPGVMTMPEKDTSLANQRTLVEVPLADGDKNVEILSVTHDTKKSVDITEEKILVSGGRGIGGPQGFQPLTELAQALGGEVSSSRIGVDNGWIAKDRQVGQTGKTVRPDLYIACGISGAIQHLAGMEDSGFILAINTDPSCPMMKAADLAVVGDLNKIVPALTEAITKYRAHKVL